MEDLCHLRLMALLDELVRDKGPRRAAEERLMPVELALLEEHGLTLSPQTNWRRQALEDARRARRRRERLRWPLRTLRMKLRRR